MAETTYETVKMTDGRVVDFPGKKKLVKETLINGSDITVRLDFRNGETRSFVLPTALLARFAAHGAEQKLGDSISGITDIDDCVQTVDELIVRLEKGDWNARAEGGASASGASVLAKALVEHTGKSMDVIKAFLANKTPAEKTALRGSAALRPIIDRLEADKASKAKSVDTDALLGELDAAA